MKKLSALFGILLLGGGVYAAPLKVVTTTPDLADLARQVGGDRVKVDSLSRGSQDPHFVEAKPSLIVKVRDADLFVQTGLDLEIGWAPLLIQGARNARVQRGAQGFFDASAFIQPLEVPTVVSRAAGDVHPGGNPHFLADPHNALAVVKALGEKLAELDPAGAAVYKKNAGDYSARLSAKIAEWEKRMAPAKGARFVSYHKNLVYLADHFGLVSDGEIEPKPGIPPTPKHTADLIAVMKERRTPLILTNPHFARRTPDALARATGAAVVTVALTPDAVPEAVDYISAVEFNVAGILRALK
ncbi:MAG: zinc ABC transporter substrate-binding protein [Elusimicrobia bacterium]|nr:zinc ABC transporter substrate-binding protein [Elusimicrobiota bacterium]